jgi:NADPH:quinone reductase-like Zn-dependent oxidoreductase
MKAIYLTKYGASENAFEMRESPKPVPAEDEILIKVHYSGINFADIMARKGMYEDAPKNPAVLGYDVSGEVVEIGNKVGNFSIGQKVFALTRFGGYAEYAIAKAFAAHEIPLGYDLAKATALATQSCTAYYCAVDSTTLHKGDRVLVQAAAGGVGSLLVQIAKHKGCYVYGTASTSKQTYLKELGVDFAIDYTKQDFSEIIKKNEKDGQIDVVFDSLGGSAFGKATKLLAPAGKMICYGAAEQLESEKNKLKLLGLAWGFGIFSPISLLKESKALITINMLRIADFKPNVFSELLTHVVSWANQGIINPHLDKIFSAENITEAHQYVESRKSLGKVVLEWK